MTTVEFRKGRALLGFMGMQDAQNFLTGACVIENSNELQIYMEKWKSANKIVSGFGRRAPSHVEQREIGHGHAIYLQKLMDQEIFKRTFGFNQTLREVEIEGLVSFQRNIDTDYTAELADKMHADEEAVLEKCLPLNFEQRLEITFDQTIPGVSFSSFSPKLVLSGLQITGLGGPPVIIGDKPVQQPGVLFLIGTQANYVQVVEYSSRFFLKNGYHRTYAALIAGRKFIPAVVLKAHDFSETGAANLGFFSKELLMSDAPPLLRDFLNDDVTADVKLRPMRKILRIRVDEFSVPR